jgi:hypothetical protein
MKLLISYGVGVAQKREPGSPPTFQYVLAGHLVGAEQLSQPELDALADQLAAQFEAAIRFQQRARAALQ